MSSCHSPNSANSTEFHPIKLANGSKTSACEHPEANRASRHSPMVSYPSGQADNRERTTTFGTGNEPPPSSTQWATQEPDSQFVIRSSGNIGQEIVDGDGRVVAWTTDEWVAAVICKLLNENNRLLAPLHRERETL